MEYIVADGGYKYIIEVRGSENIKVINQTELRANIKDVLDDVCKGEAVLVSRKAEENVVIISEREYSEYKRLLNHEAQAERLTRYGNAIASMNHDTIGDLKKALNDVPDDLKVEIIIKHK